MPGASEPVSLQRLYVEPSRAFSVAVTFPAGWRRPVTGHYLVAEDFLVLSGSLIIGQDRFKPLDWVHLPEKFSRETMSAPDGACVVARFSGPARWVDGPSGTSEGLHRLRLPELEAIAPTPIGSARLLDLDESKASWLVPSPNTSDAVTTMEAQLVDLGTNTWHHLGKGAPVPPLQGPVFCWTFEG